MFSTPIKRTIPKEHKDFLLICTMASYGEGRFLNQLRDEKLEEHKRRERDLIDNGWKPLSTSEELQVTGEGYFGVAYHKFWRDEDDSIYAEVVIAHRVTCFDEKGNILADIQIAQQRPPKILQVAKVYIAELFALINSNGFTIEGRRTFQKRPIRQITHIGFSLGGFIAGACACLSRCNYVRAVTFDAPGAAYLEFTGRNKKSDRVINYVTVPNLVNTCNRVIKNFL